MDTIVNKYDKGSLLPLSTSRIDAVPSFKFNLFFLKIANTLAASVEESTEPIKILSIHEKFNNSQVGKVLEVLCEGYDKASGVYFGRSVYDSPEIDGKVYFSSKARKIAEGEFVNVRICEVLDYDLLGEAVL